MFGVLRLLSSGITSAPCFGVDASSSPYAVLVLAVVSAGAPCPKSRWALSPSVKLVLVVVLVGVGEYSALGGVLRASLARPRRCTSTLVRRGARRHHPPPSR